MVPIWIVPTSGRSATAAVVVVSAAAGVVVVSAAAAVVVVSTAAAVVVVSAAAAVVVVSLESDEHADAITMTPSINATILSFCTMLSPITSVPKYPRPNFFALHHERVR